MTFWSYVPDSSFEFGLNMLFVYFTFTSILKYSSAYRVWPGIQVCFFSHFPADIRSTRDP